MKHATFAEFEAAKLEIIKGVEFEEETLSPNQWGMNSKQYRTKENGTFYQVTDPNTGKVEFWSDKHSESRVYDPNEKTKEAEQAEEAASYGRSLHDKIRAEALKTETGFENLTQFEKFLLDQGFYYDTEEALKAAYDRAWKSQHGILITEDEFIAEAGKGGRDKYSQWNEDATRKVYRKLAAFAAVGKITNSDVYAYVVFHWCVRKPEAIIAYQGSRNEWIVNNCDTEITEERARIEVSEEFGFEASRVQIVGTPYYDATDYNFIRFNCRGWAWLMKNGDIYQVYDE